MTPLASFMVCVAAVLVARKSIPVERASVLPASVAFLLNWLWFQSAWLTYSPSHLIHLGTGYVVGSVWLWAFGDAITGFYIFSKAVDRTWGHVCFWLFVVQEIFHALYLSEVIAFKIYSTIFLDATFIMQVACILWGGRSGITAWARGHHDDGCMDHDRKAITSRVSDMGQAK